VPPQCWHTRIVVPPNFFSAAHSSHRGRAVVWHLKKAIFSVCVRQQTGGCALDVLRREKSDLRYDRSPARTGFAKSTRIQSFSVTSPVRIKLRMARRSYSSSSYPDFSTRNRAESGG